MSANLLTLLVPVADGKLTLSDGQKAMIGNCLRARAGKTVEVKFARPVNTRSVQANRWYWGVCLGTIAEATGNSTEDLHVVLRDMFLPRRFIKLGTKEVEVRKTTTDLSTEEFSNYLEAIQSWAASELGITMPDRP